MELKDIMHILEDMKVGVFATLDEYGNPHARHAHITAANEEGIFFMTSPETHFYDQLMGDQRVAMTAISEEGYLVHKSACRRDCQTCGKRLSKDSFCG